MSRQDGSDQILKEKYSTLEGDSLYTKGYF